MLPGTPSSSLAGLLQRRPTQRQTAARPSVHPDLCLRPPTSPSLSSHQTLPWPFGEQSISPAFVGGEKESQRGRKASPRDLPSSVCICLAHKSALIDMRLSSPATYPERGSNPALCPRPPALLLPFLRPRTLLTGATGIPRPFWCLATEHGPILVLGLLEGQWPRGPRA